MIPEEIGELVDKEFMFFLEHDFEITIGYQTNMNVGSYKASYINSSALMNYIQNSKEPSIHWRF